MKKSFLAAFLLIGGLTSSAYAHYATRMCQEAWEESLASETCSLTSIVGKRRGSRKNRYFLCTIEANCSYGDEQQRSTSIRAKHTTIDDVVNCNGHLERSNC